MFVTAARTSTRFAATAATVAVPYRTPCLRNASMWSRLQTVVKTFIGRKEESPRQLLERKDLGMSLLASTHLRLRKELSDKPMDDLVDMAVEILEKHGMDDNSIVQLRYELQCVLAPEVCKVFENFQYVDDLMKKDGIVGDIDADLEKPEKNPLRKQLEAQYASTLASIGVGDHPVNSSRPNPDDFLNQKCNAMKELLSYHGWASHDALGCGTFSETAPGDDFDSQLDDFGFNSNLADDETNQAIRYHQALNVCRSNLIRDELDYSVISLKSTIPGAGRGVFVDGNAKAGSIVAFFPGEVWPREYLLGASSAMERYFKQDSNYQLSLRYDDIAIDSRKSPYTVLNEDGSNPWAIAHIVNHPPPNIKPNCRTVMINYTEPMKLDSSGLKRYVPNTYARSPPIFGQKALDRDVIVMHGMALIASRDVRNEELFYDYRLSPPTENESYPDWYHVVDPDEAKNRWWRSSSSSA